MQWHSQQGANTVLLVNVFIIQEKQLHLYACSLRAQRAVLQCDPDLQLVKQGRGGQEGRAKRVYKVAKG